eukprot:5506906-Pyramimonas_sp.AAC.1
MRLRPDFDAEGDGADDELALFWGVEVMYFHLADVTFSPWSFWVDVLVEADEREVQAGNPSGDEFVLKARCSESPTLHFRVARFGHHHARSLLGRGRPTRQIIAMQLLGGIHRRFARHRQLIQKWCDG